MTYEYRLVAVELADLERVCNEQGAEGFRFLEWPYDNAHGEAHALFERQDNSLHAALAQQGSSTDALRLMIADAFGVELVNPNEMTGTESP